MREFVIERIRKAAFFYLQGEVTLRDAANRYGVSYGAVFAAVKRARSAQGGSVK